MKILFPSALHLLLCLLACTPSDQQTVEQDTEEGQATESSFRQHNVESDGMNSGAKLDLTLMGERDVVKNPYLIFYRKGILNLCCYERLFDLHGLSNPGQIKNKLSHGMDSLSYEEVNGDTVEIIHLYNETSHIEWSPWTDTAKQVNYAGIRYDSFIKDSSIVFNDEIKIGMPKTLFFENNFTNAPDSIFTNAEIISISENEAAEDYVNYHFANDTLTEISFRAYE